jgi:hypothetical protein
MSAVLGHWLWVRTEGTIIRIKSAPRDTEILISCHTKLVPSICLNKPAPDCAFRVICPRDGDIEKDV